MDYSLLYSGLSNPADYLAAGTSGPTNLAAWSGGYVPTGSEGYSQISSGNGAYTTNHNHSTSTSSQTSASPTRKVPTPKKTWKATSPASYLPGYVAEKLGITADTEQDHNKVEAMLLKTKMCRHFALGRCHSAACRFAHSPSELRGKPDLSKTKICPAVERGQVCRRPRCGYAHGDHDLKVTLGIYKTQLCTFHERGRCLKGDSCRHAHGAHELRKVDEDDAVECPPVEAPPGLLAAAAAAWPGEGPSGPEFGSSVGDPTTVAYLQQLLALLQADGQNFWGSTYDGSAYTPISGVPGAPGSPVYGMQYGSSVTTGAGGPTVPTLEWTTTSDSTDEYAANGSLLIAGGDVPVWS